VAMAMRGGQAHNLALGTMRTARPALIRPDAEEMEMKRMVTTDLTAKRQKFGSKMFQSNDQVNEDRNQIT